ncbi:trypco2 family protein [Frankia sp. Cas3]|uniref:trypco2 family protein n=1 Tax=Frankia sp. Cas3 TaxID=3073926 RepID=UPI002AD277C8|nr:trypco2 family protein [Frankia sp. Cas3]
MAEVPLARAITQLRTELAQAMADGADERLKFALESVVLDLQVAITSTGKSEAKAGLWSVLTFGASADHTRGSVHKLTLTLSPMLVDAPPGQKVLVGRDGTGLPPLPEDRDPDEG